MRCVLIAGVSGAIGRALAEHYLSHTDAQIIGLCRSQPHELEALVERFSDRLSLIDWRADEPDSLSTVRDVFTQRPTEAPALDTIIYATGILHSDNMWPEKRLEDLSANAMEHAFAVNATGFALLLKALMPFMRHKTMKRIAAVSAKVGSIEDNGFGGWYAYRASKAALNMLVKNFSVELPRKYRPVACVAVHPGTTYSRLSEPFQKSLAQLKVHTPEDTAKNIAGVVESLTEAENGRFFNWDGASLPW